MWPRELVVAQTQAIHQLHASPKKATTEGLWGTQTRLVEAVTVCANPCVCSPCTATRCSLRMCFWHWPAWACSLFWICHVFLAPRRCKASLDPSDQAVPWLLNLELTRACRNRLFALCLRKSSRVQCSICVRITLPKDQKGLLVVLNSALIEKQTHSKWFTTELVFGKLPALAQTT